MRIVFTEIAQRELEDAASFYETELEGLGRKFKAEAKAAVVRISKYPRMWSEERGGIRKCLLHRFPYKLLYSIEEDHILILVVAHQHRKPDYWVDRLE